MEYLFDRDIFLVTQNDVAETSVDRLDSNEASGTTVDFTDGEPFAKEVMEVFPDKRSLIDLGTATGWVPFTARRAGMLAVGLEGSEKPKQKNVGAWAEMPEIVRTCDIGKPFRITNKSGNDVKFDLVTSWGVLEHIPVEDFDRCLENVYGLMHADSLGILNIDLGYNPADNFHMLWAETNDCDGKGQEDFLFSRLSRRFDVLYATSANLTGSVVLPTSRDLVGDETRLVRDWNYCRPTESEKVGNRKLGAHIHCGRSFWWIKRRSGR